MAGSPRAFRLDRPDVVTRTADAPDLPHERLPEGAAILVTEEPMEAVAAADGVPVLRKRRGRVPWLSIFSSAVGSLVSLAIGLGIERFLADLFATAPWAGWLALALVAVALLSLLGFVIREVAGVMRERRIEHLRAAASAAISVRDAAGAKSVVADLDALYGTAGTSAPELEADIMEADDRLGLAEFRLVRPRDDEAKRAIASAAKQVSVVTALSPRAIVDVAFVVYAAARLLRAIARIYGARPGFFGFLRLARAAFNHLAVTGGVAVGDSLLQQVLGLGLAARISAKLGEGVLNGLMTARFGLAALEVCRPLPFIREAPPRLADVAGDLVGSGIGAGRVGPAAS